MRQNSKGYVESPEFLPVLGLFISRRTPSLQLEVNEIPSSLYYKKKFYTYIYGHQADHITLLACAHG